MCIIHKGFRGKRAVLPASILVRNLISLNPTILYEIIHANVAHNINNAMKHLYLILVIIHFSVLSFGQNAYISTDSTGTSGIKLIDGGDLRNSMFCQEIRGDSIIKYSPYELKEYGFKNGEVYVSKNIQIADSSKRVFLECLNRGKTTLYYYKGKNIQTFFIEKDSTPFVELPKKNLKKINYSEQLLSITKDCPNVTDACKLTGYSKKSLTKLIERYNNCELKPFPHFKYGIIIGYEFSRLTLANAVNEWVTYINDPLRYFKNTHDGSFSSGIFIDNPILVSDFSLHVELLYYKHGYSSSESSENGDFDFVANYTLINVPILIRYTYPSNSIRPFANIGLNGSYFIKKEALLDESTIETDAVITNRINLTSLFDNYLLGYVIGTGIEFKLNFRNALFLELRYIHQYGLDNPKSLQIAGFNLLTGISF